MARQTGFGPPRRSRRCAWTAFGTTVTAWPWAWHLAPLVEGILTSWKNHCSTRSHVAVQRLPQSPAKKDTGNDRLRRICVQGEDDGRSPGWVQDQEHDTRLERSCIKWDLGTRVKGRPETSGKNDPPAALHKTSQYLGTSGVLYTTGPLPEDRPVDEVK